MSQSSGEDAVIAPDAVDPAGNAQAVDSLYRVFWRWHFYAGMLVMPILLIVSATGGLYVFRGELEPLLYRQLMIVEPSDSPLPIAEQVRLTEAATGGTAERVTIPVAANRSTIVGIVVEEPGKKHRFNAYVDPASGELLGTQVPSETFFNIVLAIHRRLMADHTGRTLVEIMACWTIVLCLTGVFLWWPRKAKQLRGVWWPRLAAKPYMFWRDLHAVPSAYLFALMILVVFTGLFFTRVWGAGFTMVASTVSESPREVFSAPKVEPIAGQSPLDLDAVLKLADDNRDPNQPLNIRLPAKLEEGYVLSQFDDESVFENRVIGIDPYRGEVVQTRHFSDLPLMMQTRRIALSTHMGAIGGLATKILAVIVCMALMGAATTGPIMWWKRRRKGTLGLPKGRLHIAVPRWIVAVIVLLGFFLPLFGLSVLIVITLDWLFSPIRRVRSKRKPEPAISNA